MRCSICFIFLFVVINIPLFAAPQEKRNIFLIKFIAVWGEEGSGKLQFKEPHGISVSPEGYIYIADTGNQRIQKIDSSGRFICETGGFGWNEEEFNNPVSICAKNGLDLFIADYNNQRIERYDKDLNYIASFTSSVEQEENLQMGYPLDADISSQGELFCLDGDNYRILKIDLQGEPQLTFGGYKAGIGRLTDPARILISQNNRVYVSEREKASIFVYDIYGNYLFQIGAGRLEKPAGLSMINSEYLLVVDESLKEILIFSTSGSLIKSFNKKNYSGRSFKRPVDVACWKRRIYVLDKGNSVIDLFSVSFNREH